MLVQHFHSNSEYQQFIESQSNPSIDNLFSEDKQVTADNSESKATVVTLFVHTKFGSQEMNYFPDLKYIATRSTGFDHIDLEEAKARGIEVCNVPFYGENTVAEHTFALLLGIARHLPNQVKRSHLCNFNYQDLRGFDLQGKTIGVIGAGHIGLHTIKIAQGFGMKVLAFDIYKNTFLPKVMDYEYVDLDTLITQSDIITLHAPYNKHTHHIVNQKAISRMKDGVVIINTSRGSLVDNQALLEGIQSGKVLAAGLDVLENEEDLLNCISNPLLEQLVTHNRVYFTPHTGYYTLEAQQRIWQTTWGNILGFASGEGKNLVF